MDLPDPLFRELKACAALRGVKMKELLADFIENGLRNGKSAAALSTVRSPLSIARRATGNAIRALDNAQIAKILDAEDAHAGH